jgi:adenylate cyclase, class 2
MQTEIEAKFLGIDVEGLRKKLKESGASLVHPERLMRRKNFDYADRRLYAIGGWIRVRDEGGRVTLSYKRTLDDSINGTKEIEIIVDNFEKTTDFLQAIGLDQKSFQETKRERWLMDGVEVTLDTWPWIPSFAELEGETEEKVKEAALKLGLDISSAMHGGVAPVYCKYFGVTCNEVNEWESIVFVPVPYWLEIKRLI